MIDDKVVISANDVAKTYSEGDLKTDVLKNVNFSLKRGETMSIVGSSGSGKSTLLHILGGLDSLNKGEVFVEGRQLSKLSDSKRGEVRNRSLGFVYQFHHLLPEFTVIENVCMPLLIRGEKIEKVKVRAENILARVGLTPRQHYRPSELSGGERQRCAVARALVTRPACVLGDEPTGNLDEANARHIFELMLELNAEIGTSLIIVTHDKRLAARMNHVYELKEGRLHKVMN